MMRRLETIQSLIRPGIGTIDVGTDHGLLPIALAKQGYAGNLIASDIHSQPLQAARRNAAEEGVEQRISFRLSDGLDACQPDEVDTVILSGMGGDLVCSILDRAEWTMDPEKQLILQPMTKAEILRFWLCNNGYEIEEECLVQENGRIFQILSARFQGRNTPMKDGELFLGKWEKVCHDPLYREAVSVVLERLEKKTGGLQLAGAPSLEIRFYQNIIRELCEASESCERT